MTCEKGTSSEYDPNKKYEPPEIILTYKCHGFEINESGFLCAKKEIPEINMTFSKEEL
jgi:hypothetical protein